MEDNSLLSAVVVIALLCLFRAVTKKSGYRGIKTTPRGPNASTNPSGFNPMLPEQPKKQMTALIPLRIAQGQRREDLN